MRHVTQHVVEASFFNRRRSGSTLLRLMACCPTHQAIAWTNTDDSSLVRSWPGIHLAVISQWVPMLLPTQENNVRRMLQGNLNNVIRKRSQNIKMKRFLMLLETEYLSISLSDNPQIAIGYWCMTWWHSNKITNFVLSCLSCVYMQNIP